MRFDIVEIDLSCDYLCIEFDQKEINFGTRRTIY